MALGLFHIGLLLYACPPRVIFSGEPFMGIDYQTHYEQSLIVSEAISRFGKTWAYDPFFLAGQPAGTFFDVDNMGHALFTHGLTRLGIRSATAFNLFVFIAWLLAPWSMWYAARLFQTGKHGSLFTFFLAMMLSHFDSGFRWVSWAGMISFASVAYLCPLILALFYRHLQEGTYKHFVMLLIFLPASIFIHIWAFPALVVPMLGLYMRQFRHLQGWGHVRVWGLAALTLGVNLIWLWPSFAQVELLALSGKVGQANPLYLLADYLDVFINPLHTGSIATRTFFRFFTIACAIYTLWSWHASKDKRFFFSTLSFGWLAGMAYFASLLPILRETEPYRFILPATSLATIFAGPLLVSLFSKEWIRALSSTARLGLGLLILLVIPRVFHQISYFIPELLPRPGGPPIVKPNISSPSALLPTPEFQSFRLEGIDPSYKRVAAFLKSQATEDGRVLVEWWVLGEYLRWATNKHIIGGFPDRRLIHEASNIFRYREDVRFWGDKFADYLVRYNIRYLVMLNPYMNIEDRKDLLELKSMIGIYRIYRVRHLANYFLFGSGQIKTSLNRIEISNAKPHPGTQVLGIRFHYHRTLRCRPGCRIIREILPDNPTGFIRVVGTPSLPSKIIIENSYLL